MPTTALKVLPVLLVVSVSGVFAVQAVAKTKPKTKTVQVNDDFFAPKSVTVDKGDTIKFRFNGFHNVEADGKAAFKNIPNRGSGTVARKATKKGSFKLLCSIHAGMTMKLKVK